MTDERLRQLLELADASGPPSGPSGEVARRVRGLARQRRRRAVRSAVVAVAVAVLLASVAATGMWLAQPAGGRNPLAQDGRVAPPHPGPPGPVSPGVAVIDVAQARREDARLEADARRHQLAAEALLRREAAASRAASAARAGQAMARPDPADDIAAGRDRAARIMLRHGDRLLREPDPKAAAVAYQRLLDLFPASPEAAAARERLAQIKT